VAPCRLLRSAMHSTGSCMSSAVARAAREASAAVLKLPTWHCPDATSNRHKPMTLPLASAAAAAGAAADATHKVLPALRCCCSSCCWFVALLRLLLLIGSSTMHRIGCALWSRSSCSRRQWHGQDNFGIRTSPQEYAQMSCWLDAHRATPWVPVPVRSPALSVQNNLLCSKHSVHQS
jgi:hypothetical protein